jgi:holo-[acyl-carrier protein] synthase
MDGVVVSASGLAKAARGYVLGLGVDLVRVERVRKAVERSGDHFLRRVFTDQELAYCMAKAAPHQHLAARFAAKEAASKAFGTGIGAQLSWKSVSVRNGPAGEPIAILDEKALALLAAMGATGLSLTLSHTDESAIAVALLLRE